MTQWADAGLEPNEAAIQDHLLMGLLQDGAPFQATIFSVWPSAAFISAGIGSV